MISADTIVMRDSEPIDTTVDDEVVMLSVRAGAYFGLNGVGSEIWSMLRRAAACRRPLCAALASRYEVGRADAEPRCYPVPAGARWRWPRPHRRKHRNQIMKYTVIRRAYLREAAVMVALAQLAVRFVPA